MAYSIDDLLLEMRMPSPDAAKVREILAENPGYANAPNKAGWTALIEAARAGNPEMAGLLLDAGADVNYATENGMTALHFALSENHSSRETIALLCTHGANVEARTSGGHTPLHHAGMADDIEGARELIAQGADRDALDNHGLTPYDQGTGDGQSDEIAELLMPPAMAAQAGNSLADAFRDGTAGRITVRPITLKPKSAAPASIPI